MTEITVYSTPTCPWCIRVKDFLKKNGVQFSDKNVAADASAREAMVKKTGQLGVPVIEIDGQILIGFDEDRIRELLRL